MTHARQDRELGRGENGGEFPHGLRWSEYVFRPGQHQGRSGKGTQRSGAVGAASHGTLSPRHALRPLGLDEFADRGRDLGAPFPRAPADQTR